jgi:hypothetical protein
VDVLAGRWSVATDVPAVLGVERVHAALAVGPDLVTLRPSTARA